MKKSRPKSWFAGSPANGIPKNVGRSQTRLKEHLQIGDGDLADYVMLFTAGKKNRPLIMASYKNTDTDGPTPWRTYKRQWSEQDILRHLAGQSALGLFWGSWPDHLMLDFDTHDSRSTSQVQETAGRVINSLPGEWLLYQSSFSGGIRAVCFLDGRYSRFGLDKWLKRKLDEAGFGHKTGVVESRMGMGGDRLPFGMGSMLINPFTLDPIYDLTLSQTLEKAVTFSKEHKLKLGEEDFQDEELGLGRKGSDFNAMLQRLEDEGLWPEISTNDALLALNWNLQGRKGFSRDQAAEWLKRWVRKRHNGWSKRTNRGNITDIDCQVDRIADGFDHEKYQGGRRLFESSDVGISLEDVASLLEFTKDYKILEASFSLLQYTITHSTTPAHPQQGGNYYSKRKLIRTPDINITRNPCDMSCPIPWKALLHLDGFPKNNPRRMRMKLEDLGIIKLKTQYSTVLHRCREYWVLFPFSPNPSVTVSTLEDGLKTLLSASELRDIFGPYRARKIMSMSDGPTN